MANNRWYRIAKDGLFVAIAIFLIVRGRVFGAVLGILAAYWYGRDLAQQFKMLRQEGSLGSEKSETKVRADDGKITVTDPNTKEVDFEKE